MLAVCVVAYGTTVYVNGTTGDDSTGERGNPNKPFKTIQAGINVAFDDDIILVADGTYGVGEGRDYLDFDGKAITVTSENGPENTIINAQGNVDNLRRTFYFQNQEGSDSILSGFTLTGGYEEYGGAIVCDEGTSPIIQNNIILGNMATFSGGGIVCINSSPTIENNTMEQNTAMDNGGGIACTEGSPIIKGNTIKSNTAMNNGGGIACESSTPVIENNIIIENKAMDDGGKGNGGGIVCTASSPTIRNNTIKGNTAMNNGGGIACEDSIPIIENNIIMENMAADSKDTESNYGGGAAFNGKNPQLKGNIIMGNSAEADGGGLIFLQTNANVTNNLICENLASGFDNDAIASGGGGGVLCIFDNSSMVNNTITANSADIDQGGGIYVYASSAPYIVNTICWENDGGDVFADSGAWVTIAYSDVGTILGPGKVIPDNNISDNPLWVNPDNGDYHLSNWSSCIGSGTASYLNIPIPTKDIEGHPRGTSPDIGAYENDRATPLTPMLGDVNGDESVTPVDISLIVKHVAGIIELFGIARTMADVSGDGTISSLDAALACQYIVGLIEISSVPTKNSK